MRWIMLIIVLVFLMVASLAAYVRLAPVDPEAWHAPPDIRPGEVREEEGGFGTSVLVEGRPANVMTRLDAIAVGTPRTRVIQGVPSDQFVTYETRSRFFGFPDYTTVLAYGEGDQTRVEIYGRLRFGRSDMGVNRERVTSWLTELRL